MAFRQRGAERVAGCDPDLQMISRASVEATRQQAEIGYVIAAAEQLPFGDRSFDIVSLITVLAFMPKPGLALAEIARVLRPGGRLVLGDLGKWSSWAAFRRIRAWRRGGQWAKARFRTGRQLCRLTEAGGLSVETVRGAVFYPRWAPAARVLAPADPGLGRVTTIGAAFIAPASSNATRSTAPSPRRRRMKSTSRIELRTMIPASAINPIIEVAVNGACSSQCPSTMPIKAHLDAAVCPDCPSLGRARGAR
jgi:SAM-dependent methyltransferase